jgi:ATP-dependent RNA helicase RhlE
VSPASFATASVDKHESQGSPAQSAPGFSGLGLLGSLLHALRAAQHAVPTPIQTQAIPPALLGRDVLGCARTGTGKTAAFVLPTLQRLLSSPAERGSKPAVRALILAPTRELASQIGDSIAEYGRGTGVRHLVIFGGVSQERQVRELRRGADILVATPGRLLDLIDQGLARIDAIEILVLDEFDRMLDQGFLPAIRRVLTNVPGRRQTLLFSATMPRELEAVVKQIVRDPVRVAVNATAATPELIEQSVWFVEQAGKRSRLETLLRDPGIDCALVFARTKHGANRIVKHLVDAGIQADAIHGNKSQNARENTLARFRNGDLRVLVATDIAARGIDVDGISHVINFDLPADPETYVHRIGRTARAGRSGAALSLCTADERGTLTRIERLIGRSLRAMNGPDTKRAR